MANGTVRKRVWDLLVEADYRSRCYADLASRSERLDRALSIGITFFSTAAVATLAVPWPRLAALPALVVAGLATWQAFSRPARRAVLAGLEHARRLEQESQLEDLWYRGQDMSNEAVCDELHRIAQTQKRSEESLPVEFQFNERACRRIQAQVERCRGTRNPEASTAA